jgi:TonB family protein
MNWVSYLIQLNLYLVLFYTFYWVFLKNETFFNLNRAYLVGAAVFSALIPLIKPEWFTKSEISNELQYNWTNANMVVMQGFTSPVNEEVKWVLGDYLTLIYVVITAVLIVNLVIKLVKVSRLLRLKNHPEAFSFFNKIWVNKQLPQYDEITKHELTHAKHLHSADVLFFEIICIINWFNPVCYIYKRAVKHIHEFIADEQAIKNSNQVYDYAMLLFNKSFGVNPNQLTNNFFNQSMLKRRIQMLQKEKSKKVAILKYGLSVPLFLLAMVLSSATISKNETIEQVAEVLKPKLEISEILVPEKVAELVKPEKEKVVFAKPLLKLNADEVFDGFKKYLLKTLSFPKKLNDYGIDLKIAYTFDVNGKGLIEGVKQASFVDGAKVVFDDIDVVSEAVTKISSFKEKVNIAEGTYTLFVNYVLNGSEKKKAVDATKSIGIAKNFIGEITVTGFGSINNALNEVVVSGYATTNEENNQIFQNVEVLPSFPGGLEAFGKFLASNIKYPAIAKNNKIQGRVYCIFVVEKDGSLSNIRVVRGLGSGCDEEAVRVLAISPKWDPGIQNGRPVRVSYTIPIFFKMDDKQDKTDNDIAFTSNIDEQLAIVKSKDFLLIVDGEELERKEGKSIYSGLDSSKIDKVEVINKDRAFEIYGEKGKNGVVLITTKKKK